MNTQNIHAVPVPPSLTKSLMAGFDTVSNHVGLILFSISLDILLWFGPRLRLSGLIQSFLDKAMVLPEMQSSDINETLKISRQFWWVFAEQFNVLSILRTLPVGIPSLMVSRSPIEVPFGMPIVFEVSSLRVAFIVSILLVLVGLIIGTLYFSVVSQAAVSGKILWRQAMQRWPWASVQILLLTVFGVFLLLATFIPFSCFLSILLLSGLGFERFSFFFILIFCGILLWWLLPLFFSPHGIFVNQRVMWTSVRDSIRLTRQTLPTTGLLVLVFLVISVGLDFLWKVPPETSWLAMIGVIGHSFVATSLLATSFIYYHAAYQWVHELNQQAELSSL
ncbi:hypothetical protein ACFLV7_06815 [Chloroflexota bacterium]